MNELDSVFNTPKGRPIGFTADWTAWETEQETFQTSKAEAERKAEARDKRGSAGAQVFGWCVMGGLFYWYFSPYIHH